MIPLAVRRAAIRDLTVADLRFWSHVDVRGPVLVARLGRCWQWTGSTQERDRGKYARWRVAGRNVYGHRWALGTVEPLIAGLEVDHRCRNLLCVRPSHLEQVTGAENRRRANAARPRITACRRAGHPLEGLNRVVRPSGRVECRTCIQERPRAVRERRARARR